MAVAMSRSPFSEGLLTLSASGQIEDTESPLPNFPVRRRTTVTSHYRPHSTIYLQEDHPEQKQQHPEPGPSRRNSILGNVFRHRPSSSAGGSSSSAMGMGLGMMKKSLSECTTTPSTADKNNKGKMKEKPKELPKLRIRKLSDNAVKPVSVTLSPTPPAATKMSRPRTSVGAAVEAGAERAFHRLKAQRSVASLFSAAVGAHHNHNFHNHDVSPNPVLFDSRSTTAAPPLVVSQSSHNSAAVAITHTSSLSSSIARSSSHRMSDVDHNHHHHPLSPTSTVRHTKRALLQAEEHLMVKSEMIKDREALYDTGFWLSRSRTKLHPYTTEALNMQAYDITNLDNDCYTDLLLRRLNPTSPSFLDWGKKPPVTILDIGCGRGHWCLWAASVWKNAQVTGFDMVDITLPAFGATENLTFVRGNFLYKLPFPSKSFDYIRIANIAYCVPHAMWPHLLENVKRLLVHGGRLEVIDDQIYFPYGEEPKPKEPVAVPRLATPTAANPTSFFDDGDDDEQHHDSDSDGEGTLEEVSSTSTTSTLVNEGELNASFDKFSASPCASKRSSGQSNPGVPRIVEEEEEPPQPISEPLASSPEEEPSSAASDPKEEQIPPPPIPASDADPMLGPVISPSPTITQDNVNALDEEGSLPSSATFTQSPVSSTFTALPNEQSPSMATTTRHRKNASVSSVGSSTNVEAISSWKQHKDLSVNIEAIFESLLLKRGVHPRPAEFLEENLRAVYGNRTGKKVASFHVKLAPYDSPIGPGGAMAPPQEEAETPTTPTPMPAVVPALTRLDKEVKTKSSDNLRKHWMQLADKEKRKEKKQEKKQEKEDKKLAAGSERATSLASTSAKKSLKDTVVTAKAASRLGLLPNAPPTRTFSSELSTGSDESSGESFSSRVRATSATTALGALSARAATRLGVAAAVPLSASRSHDPKRPSPSRTLTAPSIRSLSPHPDLQPMSPLGSRASVAVPLSPSGSCDTSRPSPTRTTTAPAPPPRAASRLAQAPLRPISRSVSGTTSSDGHSTIAPSNSSDPHLSFESTSIPREESDESDDDEMSTSSSGHGPMPPTPPALSAKAAGRLGISYSVLAAATATHSRSTGVMAPVQSPGILVWPDTYIPMSSTELEMHACKHVQVLLGCRHAMKEYVTGEFDGQRLASEEEFDEAFWEYECFRRSRLHWPNDPTDLFKEQGFPEPPPATAPAPARRTVAPPPTAPKGHHSRSTSLDSFNGQYRRDDMTHLRTIRVFEAVKDEKSVFALLTNNGSGR